MQAFYIPIYIKTTIWADEKICVGMMYVYGQQLYFQYVDKKLQWALQFTANRSRGAVIRYFKRINKITDEVNQDESLLQSLHEPLSLGFYKKLQNNTVNYIVWGDVVPIQQEIAHWKMDKLFRNVVGIPQVKEKKSSAKKGFRKRQNDLMGKKIFDIFKKNYVFKPEEWSGIYVEHKVDLLILQSKITAVQFVNFNASPKTVERNILHFTRIIKVLEDYSKLSEISLSQFYIAYEAPKKQSNKALLSRVENDQARNFQLVPMNQLVSIIRRQE